MESNKYSKPGKKKNKQNPYLGRFSKLKLKKKNLEI